MTTEATPEATITALQGENRVLAEKLASLNGRLVETSAQATAVAAERDSFKEQVGTIVAERDTFRTQLTTVTTERDLFRTKVTELEPKVAKVGELEMQVQTLTNTARESALLEHLRPKLPGADTLALRGVVQQLHDAGKINRFAEKPAEEAAKALPIITSEAPSLARSPNSRGGGSQGAGQTPNASGRKSLVG